MQDRGELMASRMFIGGPPKHFARIGAMQLATLLLHGLQPDSVVLDVGCGALRGGYWLLHFLEPDSYCGLEPNKAMVDTALEILVEPEIVREKRPRFSYNDSFDFSVFGCRFDFVLARSVWTHASKAQILQMLDQFVANSSADGRFLTSYRPGFGPSWLSGIPTWMPKMAERLPAFEDYRGTEWVGRSHESSEAALVGHSYGWIAQACRERALTVEQLRHPVVMHQHWLLISRRSSGP